MTQDRYEHARQNAKAWAEQLIALHAQAQGAHDDVGMAEGEEEEAREMPLTVEVRSGWYDPARGEMPKAEEYQILLTTGGPALRIIGELDDHGQPDSARLEIQDWYLPWDEVGFMDIAPADLRDALMWFVNLFYYGE